MKALFLIYEGWPGVANAIRSIKKFIEEKFPHIQTTEMSYGPGHSSFKVLKSIKSDPPDFLFLGGWDLLNRVIVENTLSDKTQINLLWCSPITQCDLGDEVARFSEVWKLSKSGKIDNIFILFEHDYEFLKILNKNIIFSPVIIDLEEIRSYCKKKINDNKTHFDIFCAPCPRKNIFAQMMAIVPYIDRAKLHLNYPSNNFSCNYFESASILIGNENFTNHQWLDRKSYLSLIAAMDCGMQVSLSESFNYVAAEHMAMKIPVIMSMCSPISKTMPKDLAEQLVVFEHDLVGEISNKVNFILSLKQNELKVLGERCRDHIVSVNNRHRQIFEESLEQCFSAAKIGNKI